MARYIYVKPIWVVLGTAGVLSATLIPTVIHPYLFPEKWKKIQAEGRAGMDEKSLYPFDETMNRWTNPFKNETQKKS